MRISHYCINAGGLAFFFQKLHHHIIMTFAVAPTDRIRANSSGKRAGKKPAPRRITVALSPEAQQIVERFKNASGSSTSAAIDKIILCSEPKPSRLKEVNGFLVLDVPADRQAVHFTLEDVKQAEDDMDREYVERLMPRKKGANFNGTGAGIRE
jgi:hypothetical protein